MLYVMKISGVESSSINNQSHNTAIVDVLCVTTTTDISEIEKRCGNHYTTLTITSAEYLGVAEDLTE